MNIIYHIQGYSLLYILIHYLPLVPMGMPLCFYVLGAFLPSVPCRARDADLPRIKTPPDGAAQVARRQITSINLRFICNLAASGAERSGSRAPLSRDQTADSRLYTGIAHGARLQTKLHRLSREHARVACTVQVHAPTAARQPNKLCNMYRTDTFFTLQGPVQSTHRTACLSLQRGPSPA